MSATQYMELTRNPPTVDVKKDAREVVINIVSVMCDNPKKMTFKKNDEGDFKLSCHGDAYSNFQIKYDKDELEWAADEGQWNKVVKMINSGTTVVKKLRSR